MNGIILRVFAAALLVAVGHALQCYKCNIGIFSLCATSTTTCNNGELCYSGVGTAGGFVDITMKGCLAEAECNKTSQTTVPGDSNTTIYSMTKTCCDMDLCNAAPPPGGLPLVPLLLATLTSLFMATVLV